MQIEVLKGGWVKQGSIIAFPYEWQRPAKTEEWVYETLISNNVYSSFVEFTCYPWATLIDLIDRNKKDQARNLINALSTIPPKKTLIRATACQHIRLNVLIPYLKELKITDVYWAHKTIHADELDGIRLHPMALFPYAYFNNNQKIESRSLSSRKYLYGFVGAYDEQGYMTDVRGRIFRLPARSDSVVIRRREWHFEDAVYRQSMCDTACENIASDILIKNEQEYSEIIAETVFSLCPSGSGPNSIRLWESIAFKCIPVILSNDLDLPPNIENYKFIRFKEEDLEDEICRLNISCVPLHGGFIDGDISVEMLKNILGIFTNKNILNLLRY